MVKRINALIPEDMHRALRVKLAEDEANFSDWLRTRISEYVGKPSASKGRPKVIRKVRREG